MAFLSTGLGEKNKTEVWKALHSPWAGGRQGAGWLTLMMAGSVRLSLRMYMSLRSSRVSMMKSSVRVEICIRQVSPRKLLYE